jgi:hypothetical protein
MAARFFSRFLLTLWQRSINLSRVLVNPATEEFVMQVAEPYSLMPNGNIPANKRQAYKGFTWGGLTVQVSLITPDLARKILERSKGINFRPLDKNRVTRYTRAQQAGHWTWDTAAPLLFNPKGQLIDGNTRMHAIIASGIAMECLTIRGVSEAGEANTDTGKSRSVQQYLAFKGYKDAVRLAAMLRQIWLTEREMAGSSNHGETSLDPATAMEVLARHPEAVDYLQLARKARNLVPVSIIGYVTYWGVRAAGVTMAAAEGFIEGLVNSSTLDDGDARLLLRARLDRARASKGQLTTAFTTALTIKAWNAYLEDRPIKQLRWAGEEWPEFTTLSP